MIKSNLILDSDIKPTLMRYIGGILFSLVLAFSVFAQGELTQIVKKDFNFKDWTYRSIVDDKNVNLREFTNGNKLTLVVYFAAWCGNWKNEAPRVEKLYKAYKAKGFDVIGVAEYDTVETTRTAIAALGITFPVVYESTDRSKRPETTLQSFRKELGDTRNWGSPFNVFISAADIEPKGEVIAKKINIAAGEIIETDAEAFVRKQLGLVEFTLKPTAQKTEQCSESSVPALKKP